jgi:DNA processing protein
MYDLWLSTLFNFGSRKQNALLEHFGNAKNIFNAPADVLHNSFLLTENNIKTLLASRDETLLKNFQNYMEKSSIQFFPRGHKNYPEILSIIPDPPVGLFVMGELPDIKYAVALIGSRRCSEYGLSAARMLAKPMARHGVAVISGMARGIDSMAHKAALEGGGKTVAVLGCGVDVCYPPENRALRNEIIKNGCVVSEYPPGTEPHPSFFPARNRIISGLSSVVVVVEAGKKSGTLITVTQALEQSREVMAVPGNITSQLSNGTNNLILDGAAPVTCYEDILFMLGININEPTAKQLVLPDAAVLAPDEKVVYDSLTFDPTSFDALLRVTGLAAHVLHYVTAMLEIKGFIKKLPGMRFIKNIM